MSNKYTKFSSNKLQKADDIIKILKLRVRFVQKDITRTKEEILNFKKTLVIKLFKIKTQLMKFTKNERKNNLVTIKSLVKKMYPKAVEIQSC